MAPDERRPNLQDIEPIAPAPDVDEAAEVRAKVDEVAIAGAAGSGIPAVGAIAEGMVPPDEASAPVPDEESDRTR